MRLGASVCATCSSGRWAFGFLVTSAVDLVLLPSREKNGTRYVYEVGSVSLPGSFTAAGDGNVLVFLPYEEVWLFSAERSFETRDLIEGKWTFGHRIPYSSYEFEEEDVPALVTIPPYTDSEPLVSENYKLLLLLADEDAYHCSVVRNGFVYELKVGYRDPSDESKGSLHFLLCILQSRYHDGVSAIMDARPEELFRTNVFADDPDGEEFRYRIVSVLIQQVKADWVERVHMFSICRRRDMGQAGHTLYFRIF